MVLSEDKQDTDQITSTPELLLVADFGGMGTKAFVADGDNVLPLFMGAEIAIINPSSIKMFEKNRFMSTPPQSRAWCGFRGEYRAVGQLASQQFRATSLLKPLKYELAIFKVLALLWVASEKLNLPPQFKVSLSLLIPPGEYGDRFELEKILREVALEFDTPSGLMSIEIDFFDCKPEGAGVLMSLQSTPNLNFDERNISLTMIGYRNASLITTRKGNVVKKISSDLGMNYVIEEITNHVSVNVPLSVLLPVVVEAGSDVNSAVISRLIRTSMTALKENELQKWRDAIISSRNKYLETLQTWMVENVPLDNELIVYCGGTAHYFQKELDIFAQQKNWEIQHDDFLKIPSQVDPFKLKERIVDLFCYFCYSQEKWMENQSQTV